MDWTILAGWIILALLGQVVFNKEVEVLEWLATAWLLAGMLLVRRTTCLPLLLLSCPVFMCEIQRSWAWVQWMVVVVLLVRVWIENRFTFRQWLVTVLVGVAVLAFSWPSSAGDLLVALGDFSKRELFHQWFHADAAWAIFPFREAVDRALIAVTCTAMLLSGGYVSSHRLWKALAVCGVLVLAAAFSASLLPWQEPHRFLGTTNYGRHGQFLFQGAGTNLSFFAILLAVGLPWWFAPFNDRRRAVFLGLTGFLAPLLLVQERAFLLAVIVLTAAGILAFLWSLVCSRRRSKVLRRWRLSASAWAMAGALFVVGCLASGYWYVKMGVRDEASLLRLELRLGPLMRAKSVPPGATPEPVPTSAGVVDPLSTATGATRTLSLPARIEQWLIRHDRVRGPAWSLGVRSSLRDHLWKGAGAGTWARFHRSQPRPYRDYLAHMHNMYLDLVFEYGVIPMLLIYGLCAVAFFRIALGYGGVSRLWLLYLVPLAILATGQHLLYAFTHLCLLLPAFMLIWRALAGLFHRAVPAPAVR